MGGFIWNLFRSFAKSMVAKSVAAKKKERKKKLELSPVEDRMICQNTQRPENR